MSTMTMPSRSNLWEVTSRTIVYAAIGAALYGDPAGRTGCLIPGTTVSIRPAFAIVPFFGYAFGPIVGFFTGLVGNGIGDQLSGWGALTSWNWSIANGLVGLLAGIAPLYLGALGERKPARPGDRRSRRRRDRRRHRLPVHLHRPGHPVGQHGRRV